MKRTTIILALIMFVSIVSAQPWLSKLPQGKQNKDLTLFDYQKAFNDYWAPYHVDKGYYYENGMKIKAIGWKQYNRWFWDMKFQVDKDGHFPDKTAQQVYDEYLKSNPVLQRSTIANWTSLGTYSSDGGYAGVGRLDCIAFHPTDTNTYWVGAPSGGLWVTTDNSKNWKCLTDKNGVLGISDIFIPTDYATSKTIYIATGDRDHWANNSVGVLKSTDGGSTWDTTNLHYNLYDYAKVPKLLADPNNNQTILAATSKGVYKTTNAGANWSTQLTTTSFNDLEYQPGNFNRLYGSTTSGEIYMSSDGGANWTRTLYENKGGRTELAVSPNKPDWVYAVVANSALYGVYKSTDKGATFSLLYDGKIKGQNILGYDKYASDSGSGQGWYDLTIAVSPIDANIVIIGGINDWRSTNGGLNWSVISHWWGDSVQAVHADQHMLKYRSKGVLFNCNDGGVYYSTDDGTKLTDITNGMVTSQIYKLGVSQTVSNEIITGLQDNGTKLLSAGIWTDVKGGDGMECLIDYTDENIQYGTYVNGQIDRTIDHWINAKAIEPKNAGNGAWVTPYIIDPVNPATIYAGYADVWKTTDRGDNWTQISHFKSDLLAAMAIAPSDNKVIVVADWNTLFRTTDGGLTWSIDSVNFQYAGITSIAIKYDDPKTIWVTKGGYNSNNVFQSTDSGVTWTNISAGLPQLPAYSIVQNKQDTSEVALYVGTELGVYFKKGNNNWIPFSTNLPNVKTEELEIYYAKKPSNSRLRAATYGRGLWESNLYFNDTPMIFDSFTTTQKNISSVSPGLNDAEVICLKIETENALNPFKISQIKMSMDGTTDINDIANVKVYFTGADSVFIAANQFGTSASPAAGTITFNGNQTLVPGINHFWVSYDLKSTAKPGDFIDAKGLSVKMDTNVRIPNVTNPAGNRIISKQYCIAGASTSGFEYISNVTLGSINQSSGYGSNGYEDYSSKITTMKMETNQTITVSVASVDVSDELLIWVDWNNDGDFLDSSENVYSSGIGGLTSYNTDFAPSKKAMVGTTRMRIRLNNSTVFPNNTPCGASDYGEVEDYSINVVSNAGIHSASNVKKIVLYPNPVLNQLNIEVAGTSESTYFEIHNSIGQTVYNTNFVNKTVVDMAQFPVGFYLIKLKAGDGFLYRKFVKE
jgi:photosystem II stability/assembly factor-like uncharacterized protein